jgi:hypothetical protein
LIKAAIAGRWKAGILPNMEMANLIPTIVISAILASLIWVGFRAARRVRARSETRVDLIVRAQLEATNRQIAVLERIAAALEAKGKPEQ